MKRIMALALFFLLVLPCLLIPAFAASPSSDSLVITRDILTGPSVAIPFGDLVLHFYLVSSDVPTRNDVGDLFESYIDGSLVGRIESVDDFWQGDAFLSETLLIIPEDNYVSGDLAIPFRGIWVVDFFERADLVGISGNVFEIKTPGRNIFPSFSETSPLSPVKESMTSVLEWVGTVATSLLSGELNPLLLLLAIPIAISLIFLAIKAIKMVFNS